MIKAPFKIFETPRDALQSLRAFIHTDKKVQLLQSALQVGFEVVDIGSFVSPRFIPQFADMDEVLGRLQAPSYATKILMLTGNVLGAERICDWALIDYIAFPFSLSETFLKRNINATPGEALKTIENIQALCTKKNKKLWIYFSMAFGNPYGDPVNIDSMVKWACTFAELGVTNITLSDITAVSNEKQVGDYYKQLTQSAPGVEFGLHLHIKPNENATAKLKAAYESGCIFFDGVTGGAGGCPMTGYEMLTNLPTARLFDFAQSEHIDLKISKQQFQSYQSLAFQTYQF